MGKEKTGPKDRCTLQASIKQNSQKKTDNHRKNQGKKGIHASIDERAHKEFIIKKIHIIRQSDKFYASEIKVCKTEDHIDHDGGKNEEQKEGKERQDEQVSTIIIAAEFFCCAHNCFVPVN
jgi:hypothetical protein